MVANLKNWIKDLKTEKDNFAQRWIATKSSVDQHEKIVRTLEQETEKLKLQNEALEKQMEQLDGDNGGKLNKKQQLALDNK